MSVVPALRRLVTALRHPTPPAEPDPPAHPLAIPHQRIGPFLVDPAPGHDRHTGRPCGVHREHRRHARD